MPARRSLPLVLLALFAVACGDLDSDPVASSHRAVVDVPEGELPAEASGHVPAARNFVAPLDGGQEVPSVDTRATGLARFQLSKDGGELSYRLNVANIEDVLMAHIHLAPAGENGPVVVWLYPPDGPPPQLVEGRSDGTLATGTITGDDLVGPLGEESLDDLLAKMTAANAYVNVHTEANPAGEIRGQIMVAGPNPGR